MQRRRAGKVGGSWVLQEFVQGHLVQDLAFILRKIEGCQRLWAEERLGHICILQRSLCSRGTILEGDLKDVGRLVKDKWCRNDGSVPQGGSGGHSERVLCGTLNRIQAVRRGSCLRLLLCFLLRPQKAMSGLNELMCDRCLAHHRCPIHYSACPPVSRTLCHLIPTDAFTAMEG